MSFATRHELQGHVMLNPCLRGHFSALRIVVNDYPHVCSASIPRVPFPSAAHALHFPGLTCFGVDLELSMCKPDYQHTALKGLA